MGCFFGCFRIKDSNRNLVKPPENVVSRSKNALSSLFQCDDESLPNGKEVQNPLTGELDVKELNDEAKFLKACGTLPETPVKIRTALQKWDGKSSSLVDSPSSCITDGQNTRSDIRNVFTPKDSESNSETSAVSHQVIAPSLQRKNKSVRFECETESSAFSSKGSSSESATQHSKQFGSADNRSVTKPSPYPTPLKLTNEMQPPGAVFPAYTNNMDAGKFTKDENSDSNDKRDSLKLDDEYNVMSTPMAASAVKQFSVGKEMPNKASLSDWLKPIPPKVGGTIEQFGRMSREKVYLGKTPGDRPILGMVAAHWNDDETSHVSPKWWDGNGIPNSTNKYKEDQKVSWHATPFEERLEKALSEESFISQRKPIGQTAPFDFDETDESDTAFSHLQPSDHIKSVVSF